ncbi:hypothetical protein CCYA_CCYA08G2274 [Cyanidiococcus yangmingshanensis]|nr:hypothetical protein CCYA_CCYA08G2274 [Cyanidiococcus yangmingshanensis]
MSYTLWRFWRWTALGLLIVGLALLSLTSTRRATRDEVRPSQENVVSLGVQAVNVPSAYAGEVWRSDASLAETSTASEAEGHATSAGHPKSAGSGEGVVAGPPHTDPHAEKHLGLSLFYSIVALLIGILLSYLLLQYGFHALPDCIVYVVIGLTVGGVLRLAGDDYAVVSRALPNQEQFMLFVLPPVIFEAGYSLNKGDFFAQAGSIISFAVFGTILSTLAFGLGMWFLGVLHVSYRLYLFEALAFGSLISAVDPVATIAIFNALRVNRTLHYLVFGESVLNDAVAIVLFQTFGGMVGSESAASWWQPVVHFVYIFLGSTAIGALVGMLSALLFKYTRLYRYPVLELSTLLLLAYLPYTFCEGLGLSGIMSILANGVMMAHYTHHNLSSVTKLTSQQSFKMIAFITETFIFIYLGLALTLFTHSWHFLTVFWGILLTLLSRFVNVFPLSAVLNRYRREKINATNQFVLWFSGLRGAIAFALSLNFPSANSGDMVRDLETRRAVISTTLAIVIFTVIVLGGGTLPLLRLLRVEQAESTDAYEMSRVHADAVSSTDQATATTVSLEGDSGRGARTAIFVGFETDAPVFMSSEAVAGTSNEAMTAISNGYANTAPNMEHVAGQPSSCLAEPLALEQNSAEEGLSWLQRIDERILQPLFRAQRRQVGRQGLERFLKDGEHRLLSPTELAQIVSHAARDECEDAGAISPQIVSENAGMSITIDPRIAETPHQLAEQEFVPAQPE